MLTLNKINVKTTTARILLSILLLVVIQRGYGQTPTYDVYVANRAITSANTMEFDVFIKNNGATTAAWPLRSYQCGYRFSSGFVNGGTLTGSYVASSSDLESTFNKQWGFGWNATARVLQQSANIGSSCPGALIGSSPRKILRVRVTNSVNWGCIDDSLTMTRTGSGFTLLAITKYNSANCQTESDLGNTTITSGATSYTSSPNESLLRATVSGVLSVDCGANTSLTISGSGGLAPYSGGSTVSVGAGTYIYGITDARGCIASTSVTVSTASDVTAPVITACAPAQSGSGFSGSVPDFRGAVTATDNCTSTGDLTVTQSPAPGTAVSSPGVTQVVLTVRDQANNAATCTTQYTLSTPCPGVADTGYARRAICSTTPLPYSWDGLASFSGAGTQFITVTNSEGCDSVVSLTLVISNPPIPARPGTITQQLVTNNCGARIYRFFVAAVPNTVDYVWDLPTSVGGVSGVTVDSGDANSSRVIRLAFVSGNAALTTDSIRVRASNGCGLSASRGLKLTNTLLSPPAAPSGITIQPVLVNVCENKQYRYIAPALAAGSATRAAATGWQWSFVGAMAADVNIDSGDVNSRTILVSFGSNNNTAVAGDSVRVAFTSSCGNSPNRAVRFSNVATKVPPTPGAITIVRVLTNVCEGKTYRYIAPALPAATAATATTATATGYFWSFTGSLGASATIDSGDVNGRVIVVSFGSNNGAAQTGDSVRVAFTSACGNSLNRSTKLSNVITALPPAPGTTTIQPVLTNVCTGKLYRYIAAALPAPTLASSTVATATGYAWSFSSGALAQNAVIDSGDANGRIIVVRFTSNAAATNADSVRVAFTSVCGNGPNRSTKLTNVETKVPVAPVSGSITITQLSDSCGARVYRYTGPDPLPVNAATGSVANPDGYSWSFVGNLFTNFGTVVGGSLNSRIVEVRYASNIAAGAGDSVRLAYTSVCGNSLNRSLKLSNILKTGCPTIPISKLPELPITKAETVPVPVDVKGAQFDLRVFPNPAVSSFKLNVPVAPSFDEKIQIRILDIQGREFKRVMMMPGETLTLGSDLRPGTYIIEAVQGKERRVARLIKI